MNFENLEQKSAEAEVNFKNMLSRIREKSPYVRFQESGGDCLIEREGKKFKIERIRSSEQPEVNSIYEIMEDTFDTEELEPIEVIKAGIDGKTVEGEKNPTTYKIYALKNERGEVAAFLAGGILDLRDKNGLDSIESIFMGAYMVTAKEQQYQGFGRELYASAFIDADNEIRTRGRKFKAMAGEVNGEVEHFFNSAGFLKRAYSKINEKTLSEVKYIQPPTDWDKETGKPVDGAGNAPEHFMVAILNGSSHVSRDEVMQIVDAFYEWSHRPEKSRFSSEKAWAKAHKHVDRVRNKLEEQLSKGEEQLILLDKEERLQLKKSGIKILEHSAADR